MTTPACPVHGPLPGLGTFCADCRAYVADMRAEAPERPAKGPPDPRSEDERKADARPAVEAMGWTVLDFEQGYRPDACARCGERIPGGHSTRVPRGTPDWLVQGFGHAIWIEWKTEKNRQTPEQKAFEDRCNADGVPYFVCRNTEDALRALTYVRRMAA